MKPESRKVLDAWTAEQKEQARQIAATDPRYTGDEVLAMMAVGEARRTELVDKLMADDPLLPVMSAFTIAGDLMSVERSKEWVARGMDAADALTFVGSYGRLEFALWAVKNGHMPEDVLLEMLPDLWRGSDPDDTDPRFLALWQKAWVRNGKRTVRDGPHLPKGTTLRVYRGQDDDAPLGIAWSLDRKIAEKFARGAGTRQSSRPGTVLVMEVPRTAVLAYLTGRGESEVILPTIGGQQQ